MQTKKQREQIALYFISQHKNNNLNNYGRYLLYQQEIDQIVVNINTGDPQVIADYLATINSLEKADQRTALSHAQEKCELDHTSES